ncbi:MAG: hypothetical protein SV186_03030 [Candidatus Nanohaloarchaea archaeon]|nr:hypothetical protein [Candidatus Nanohaloarchaea archaeon]
MNFTTRKGQYAVVEQVILFALGVAILSGFLTAFNGFSRDVKSDAIQEQSALMAQVVASHTAHLVSTHANGELSFSIPDSLAGENYIINFTDGGVAVIVGDTSHLSTIYGITETYRLRGSVSSEYETAVISIEQDTIKIGSP